MKTLSPLRYLIYHNPRCSKSRAVLALLTARGVAFEIVEYLKQPPNLSELHKLKAALRLGAQQMVRRGEALWKELGIDPNTADEHTLLAAVAAHPILLERPIVTDGQSAVIGRPPERVLTWLAAIS